MQNVQGCRKIIEWLRLPETKGIEALDEAARTGVHARIIQSKPLLRRVYLEFYRQFLRAVPEPQGKVLVELGSGGGFIKEVIGNVITSDVLELPHVDRVFSATQMPWDEGSVDAFFLIDVLHHIGDPRSFFREALRCLKVGGQVVMIEPANTLWARFLFRNFHHEAFDPEAPWSRTTAGPLADANGALPWIIFRRDREVFERQFPALRIVRLRHHTPLGYLLSGGLTLRQIVPSWAYGFIKGIEYVLYPLNGAVGLFQTIELRRID
ncbi:MAG: class I SAM-dependent methyltransferase [Planctomycetes bacterium]|nr:class I SAM-dependent methyltransferase [Planctomycetota bacterium]